MKNLMKNIIASYKHIPYTYKHIKAFNKLQKETFGEILYKYHDWDKIFMYIFFPWLGTKRIKKIHKKISKHHLVKDSDYKDPSRLIEALLDWESARFTKPDKPENAYCVIHSRNRTDKQIYSLMIFLYFLNKYNPNIKLESNI